MGNTLIQKSISRDRFTLLTSKLYFANPEKPENPSKTYYVDELIDCLKMTFQKSREDSPRQSIDEGMVKFKGRCGMKQYMPLKPVRRGIKLWLRCDSYTGYCYDVNVYSGKEEIQADSTLGERVVNKLTSSIQRSDVVLCFDHFFTSIRLLETTNFPAVGTYMGNRKNTPKFTKKLEKHESDFLHNENDVTASHWLDTKDVYLASNCFTNTVATVTRKQKDGTKLTVSCPEMTMFYNKFMGGVDLCDQLTSVYDHNRRSNKWWKKVFYKMLAMAVMNAYILFKNSARTRKCTKLLDFLVPLAEGLNAEGLIAEG